MKGKKTKLSFETANQKLANVNSFFYNHREKARALQNISKSCTNGPEGTVSAATISSVQLLQKGLINCEQWISRLLPSTDNIDMNVFLTVVVENLHAVSHMKHETFSVYEYAQDYRNIFKQAMGRAWLA